MAVNPSRDMRPRGFTKPSMKTLELALSAGPH